MSNPNAPATYLRPVRTGEALTAATLNRAALGLNRQNRGVAPPRQIPTALPTSAVEDLPTSVALVLTDDSVALVGYPEVDGVVPYVGDYILVALDTVADGVYRIPKNGGSWSRIGKLRQEDGNDKVPVYEQGTIIGVYDGDSAPVAYMACTQDDEYVFSPLSGVGGALLVDLATTATVSHSGTPTIDTVSSSGRVVLDKDNTDTTLRGIWYVSTAGVWTKYGGDTFTSVIVTNGSTAGNKDCSYYRATYSASTKAQTWRGVVGVAG